MSAMGAMLSSCQATCRPSVDPADLAAYDALATCMVTQCGETNPACLLMQTEPASACGPQYAACATPLNCTPGTPAACVDRHSLTYCRPVPGGGTTVHQDCSLAFLDGQGVCGQAGCVGPTCPDEPLCVKPAGSSCVGAAPIFTGDIFAFNSVRCEAGNTCTTAANGTETCVATTGPTCSGTGITCTGASAQLCTAATLEAMDPSHYTDPLVVDCAAAGMGYVCSTTGPALCVPGAPVDDFGGVADPRPSSLPVTQVVNLSTPDDLDCFQVTVDTTTMLTIQAAWGSGCTGGIPQNPRASLYDAAGGLMAADMGQGNNGCTVLNNFVSPGTYIACVGLAPGSPTLDGLAVLVTTGP